MEPAREKTISKFMSLVLRHEPEALGVAMDEQGWVDFAELCAGLNDKFSVDRADVLGIIARDPKSRYTLNGNRIRAAQGHSLDVALNLDARTPPATLYHGTTLKAFEAIKTEGLTRQALTHVHLSGDLETARIVGSRRRGGLIILEVASGAMANDGFEFHISQNSVWLTDHVPPRYLKPLNGI